MTTPLTPDQITALKAHAEEPNSEFSGDQVLALIASLEAAEAKLAADQLMLKSMDATEETRARQELAQMIWDTVRATYAIPGTQPSAWAETLAADILDPEVFARLAGRSGYVQADNVREAALAGASILDKNADMLAQLVMDTPNDQLLNDKVIDVTRRAAEGLRCALGPQHLKPAEELSDTTATSAAILRAFADAREAYLSPRKPEDFHSLPPSGQWLVCEIDAYRKAAEVIKNPIEAAQLTLPTWKLDQWPATIARIRATTAGPDA
jgi:hypothetical protein